MSTFSWSWSEKAHNAWAAKRQNGFVRFVLVSGLLGWGLPMFALMAGGPAFFGFPHKADSTIFFWLSQAIVWAVCGLFFGWSMWVYSERQFRKHAPRAP